MTMVISVSTCPKIPTVILLYSVCAKFLDSMSANFLFLGFFPVPVVIFIGVPEEVCDVFLFLFLFSCCDISICVFGAVFICLLL